MDIRFLDIGYGNMVSAGRVIAIVGPLSAPAKRILSDARERGDLIDATCGRKTRAVLVMDNDQIILSALEPKTIRDKLHGHKDSDRL